MADGPFTNLKAETPSPPEEAISVPWERVEQFVGQLTHDIRNGLNALELQLTFLGEISTDPEAVDEVKRLRTTLQAVTRQLQTVKVATAAVLPHVLDYPVGDFFEDLRGRFERMHPEAVDKISWDTKVIPAMSVLVDPDLTINALLELLTNAVRSGAASVVCATADASDEIAFVLKETSGAELALPTEKWGEPLLTTRRGAYGLGLFRVRRILAAQGGGIAFHFSHSDKQLTTTVTLPRAASPDRIA